MVGMQTKKSEHNSQGVATSQKLHMNTEMAHCTLDPTYHMRDAVCIRRLGRVRAAPAGAERSDKGIMHQSCGMLVMQHH